MFILYDIFSLIFVLLYFPVVLFRGKWHRGFGQRFGFFSVSLLRDIGSGKKIWVHAVSVGEVLAVLGLVARLAEKFPNLPMVMTTVTKTGYDLAQARVGREVKVIYAPLDFSWTARRFIEVIQPVLYICVETEIWPNLFHALGQKGIPIVIVNGRVSDRTFGFYRLSKPILVPILRRINAVCPQTDVDAKRFLALGVRPTSVFVAGNLKFDEIAATPLTGAAGPRLRIPPGETVWMAGSTHPGEEEILVKSFKRLRPQFPHLRLVIAPRHVERVAAIKALLEGEDLGVCLFSKGQFSADAREVILIDTIGHLRLLYAQADIVYIGKTLVGRGGQNILEPAAFSKPIIVGPHMENFREILDIFLNAEAICQVSDAEALHVKMAQLLSRPDLCASLGASARRLIDHHQGATQKVFDVLSRYLPS